MEAALKIKKMNWFGQIGLPIIILSILFLLLAIWIGELNFKFLFSGILFCMGFLHTALFIQTKNSSYLVPSAFYVFAGLTFFLTLLPVAKVWLAACASIALILFVLMVIVLFSKKIKWRNREILELAAQNITETGNGFTARPFPFGTSDFDAAEIREFGNFLLYHAIAYPYMEKERTVLVVPSNMFQHILGLKNSYADETYLIFNEDGKVSVQIAEKHYAKYNEQYTFDQLCASLGNLMMSYFAQYRQGEGKSIIQQMNSLKFIV